MRLGVEAALVRGELVAGDVEVEPALLDVDHDLVAVAHDRPQLGRQVVPFRLV